jgi:transcriptional regulator of arginine metabolism
MKQQRHHKILQLIAENEIDTQEELAKILIKNGFDVTQATVSRDIKELKLVKVMANNGRYKYSPLKIDAGTDKSAKFFSLLSESVRSINYACNMVVMKCNAGMAMAVCASLDNQELPEIVGTLAGDDTIFVVLSSEQDAIKIANQLKRYL